VYELTYRSGAGLARKGEIKFIYSRSNMSHLIHLVSQTPHEHSPGGQHHHKQDIIVNQTIYVYGSTYRSSVGLTHKGEIKLNYVI